MVESKERTGSSNSKSDDLVAPDSNTNDIQSLVSVLQEFCRLIASGNSEKPPRPDVFTGDIFQDPEVFLQQLEAHLKIQSLTPAGIMQEISSYLDAEAKIWYDQHDNQIDTFDCFSELFLERYNPTACDFKLREILYTQHQQEHERAVPFLLKKKRLCNRLYPNWEEKEIIALIQQQLLPRYKFELGPYRIETTRALREAVSRIDDFIYEDTTEKYVSKVSMSPSNSITGTKPKEQPDRGPPCLYCPRHHWHRHCPVFRARKQLSASDTQRYHFREPKFIVNPFPPFPANASACKLQEKSSSMPATKHRDSPPTVTSSHPTRARTTNRSFSTPYLPPMQRSMRKQVTDAQRPRWNRNPGSPTIDGQHDRLTHGNSGQPTQDIFDRRQPTTPIYNENFEVRSSSRMKQGLSETLL